MLEDGQESENAVALLKTGMFAPACVHEISLLSKLFVSRGFRSGVGRGMQQEQGSRFELRDSDVGVPGIAGIKSSVT